MIKRDSRIGKKGKQKKKTQKVDTEMFFLYLFESLASIPEFQIQVSP